MASSFPRFGVQSLLAQLVKTGVYSKAFGTPPPTRGSNFGEFEVEVNTRLNTGADDTERLSYLGTPVFTDLWLKENDSDAGLRIDTVLMDISQQRNIVTTAIQGRNGTVKEYISDGDYQITVRGILVEPSAYDYPAEQVRELLRLCRVQAAVQAVSPFLQLFQIYDVVITDYQLPQLEGYQNMQPFELTCISDTPIELIEDA
jgi:CheY-like chemotaxis protein